MIYQCSPIKVDLVFKLSKSVDKFKNEYKEDDIYIFDFKFWEKVFSKWMDLVILEKGSEFTEVFRVRNFSLSFEIINNNEIEKLNRKWLNKTGATDVLSFPIIDKDYVFGDIDFLELGDLFVSLEMASSQSKENKHSLRNEIIWLASHGFLHLLGWEHNSDNDLRDMVDFQNYLISKLYLKSNRKINY